MSTTTVTYRLTETEMRQPPAPKGTLPSLFDEPVTPKNWWKLINWTHSILLFTTPLLALYGILTVELQTKTLIFSIIYYFVTGLGITAGYHRYWAHRSYQASFPLQVYLALTGAGAVEGSIRWWSRGHRAHHRWTDTDKDPYSAHRGVFFSHLGWMLIKRPSSRIGHADADDLNVDKLIMFQHKHYPFIALFMGFILPTLVAGLGWGDWEGGYFYCGLARLVFVHHATFCVNSLAHWLGDNTFDDRHTPRDHYFTALVTIGEGYHNFHHEFPQDYRNAILYYQYDPTKWFIWACSKVGLAYNLKTFPANEIAKGQIYMQEQKINEVKRRLKWGRPIQELPALTFEDFQDAVKNHGEKWILIEGIVYDVKDFIKVHPGGEKYLNNGMGKDMTTAFNGGMYDHSNGARNLLSTMRVAVCRGGGEVEAMKQFPAESIVDQSAESSSKKDL
jgi:stearoyl-CoA desaturase (delta-9 desaturase)